MKAKVIALALAGALAVSSFAGCGGSGSGSSAANSDTDSAETKTEESAASSGDMYEISYVFPSTAQPEKDRIYEKLDELTQKELGMHLTCTPIAWGNYEQQLNLMLSSGEKVDVVNITGNAISFVSSGKIVDMSDLIDQYGTNIKKYLGEDVAKGARIGDFVYGTVSCRDWAASYGIVMRKDILDKYNIDPNLASTIDGYEKIFEVVKQNEPELTPLGATPIEQLHGVDYLQDWFGVLLDRGQTTEVVNWYATDEYRNLCNYARDWYQKGYISQDAATATDSSQTLMRAGKLFSYVTTFKPGIESQITAEVGYDVVTVTNIDAYSVTANISGLTWGIAQNSEDKEKAMQFLDWTYGSREFNDTINWGEEGIDYQFIDEENGIIGYPDGMTPQTAKYHDVLSWLFPNQYLGYIWEGNEPTVWQDEQEFNKTALKSKAFGFQFDSRDYANELTALNNVREQYYKPLACGSVDPDEYIPLFVKALEDAGINRVIEAKQEQLDEWLAAQG